MNSSMSSSSSGLSRRSNRVTQTVEDNSSQRSNRSQRSTGSTNSNSNSTNSSNRTIISTISSRSKDKVINKINKDKKDHKGSKARAGSPRSSIHSRRSITPPKVRREFWGQNQSRRRMLTNNINNNNNHNNNNSGSQGDANSVTSVGSHDPVTPSSTGSSSMYHLFSTELKEMLGNNDAVQRVAKLMFSSLAVVFQETQLMSSESAAPFVYTRIASIPAPAARMLWTELIGGVTTEVNSQGFWTVTLDNDDKSRPPDPCLSNAIIENFTKYVNSGKDPVQNKQKEKGFWGRTIRYNNTNNKGNPPGKDEKLPERRRRNGKDPFLYFIRDALIKTGFLELAGRRVDDEEEEEEDTDEDDQEEEGPHTTNGAAFIGSGSGSDFNDNEENFHLSDGGDPNDSAVDFSGWDKRKKKLRAQSRTQYFQIYKDMQFQYGVYLSSVPVADGGFAVLNVINPDDASSDVESVAIREQGTMTRWNDAMSSACWKQLVEAGIIEKRGAERKESETRSSPSSQKLKSFDDAVTYAIQMYPSHLMRCGRVVEAARMLMLPKFFLARLSAMDPFEAANRHRSDIAEMTQRSILAAQGRLDLGGDGDSIDPKDVTLAAVNVMTKAMKERYPIQGEKEGAAHDQIIKGEIEVGEVGRALHLIAAFIGEKWHIKQSQETYNLCLKYKIAAMGPDHSSVGRTFRHMGHQHMNQYEYDDAIKAYSNSVRIERLQENIEYKHVILALNSMAMIYGMTGRAKKAVDTYKESLDIQKAQLGDTNVQVAETLNSMGIVYGMLCEFESAIQCYSESLDIKIRAFGKDHEDVADVYFNLGLVHKRNGDHEAAIKDYQEALRIRKNRLGEEHEDVARVLHHMGVVLSDMDEIGDAQCFYEECLRIRRLVLGEEHEDVARTLHNLGLVCYDSGDYNRALEYLEDAVELGRKKVGKRSEKVADSLHSIGLVHQKLANFKDAINNYEDAVKIRRARLGHDHLQVASTLHNMGDIYYMMGDLGNAMDAYEEAYLIRLNKLGKNHLDVAATRNNMGVVLMKKGEHNDAMACFTAALIIREESFGPDHEKCSDTLHNMGLVHKNLKEYDEAIGRYEQALRVRRMQLGENDMKVADTLYNMAIVYANTAHYSKALERYKEALRTYRETGMSDDHPSVVNTLQWIKWAQKKLSKNSRRDIKS